MYSQISFSDHSSSGLTLCRPYSRSHSTGAASDGAAERFYLANPAAPVTLLKTVTEAVDAVRAHPALQFCGLGIVNSQGPPVALLNALNEIVGFRVQPPGIDTEDFEIGRASCRERV